jgi:hypothetical protein
VDFMIWGSLNAGIAGAKSHLFLPLLASGQDYPTAVTKLCFGLFMLVFGLYLILLEGDMGRSPLSLIFMINALLLCFSLLVAFAAFRNSPENPWIGIASMMAVLHFLCGLALLYFAATERPVGSAGLSIGSVVYVSSAAVALVVFLSGKAA